MATLKDKRIVVVGGAGRIGRVICERLLQEGASLAIADLDPAQWEAYFAKAGLGQYGSKFKGFKVDCCSTEQVKALVKESVAHLGGIDALVNCSYPRAAGFGKSVEDLSIEEFSENLKVHLGSFFLVTKEFSSALKACGGGSIVNFSSIYGVIPPRFQIYEGTSMVQPVVYGAIKAAIIHMSKYFAKYLSGQRIRVNCVSPGGILDGQPEAFLEAYAELSLSKGMLDPADVAGAVIFLVSDQATFVNGQNIIVDDGFTL